MRFEVSPPNRPTRIAAGLVALGMGLGVAAIPSILSMVGGLGLFFTGLGMVCVNVYQATYEWLRHRRDPYDLSKLWDEPLPENPPAVPALPQELPQEDDLVYCHRCGASMHGIHAICPDCGHRLGY